MLVRPHLEISPGPPHFKEDTDKLEKVQKKAVKMIKGLEYLPHNERLEGVMPFIPEEGSGELIALKLFQHLKDDYKKERGFPSTRSCMKKTRGNRHKLY